MVKSYDIESQMRQLVFQKTREHLANRGKIASIASKAGVQSQTVSKLAYGETKYPRFHTVVAVLAAFGIELTISLPNSERVRVVK